MIEVKLLNDTSGNETLVYTAARTCYSAKTPHVIWLESDELDKRAKFIADIIKRGHESVLEHAVYTFAISGISRVTLAQLTRHRIGVSYSVKSQRYVSMMDQKWSYPEMDEAQERIYLKALENSADAYTELIEAGMDKEDARYIMPSAATTNLVMTVNARELRHIAKVRLCERAQWEIRELVEMMVNEARKANPSLFQNLDPCEGCKEPDCPKIKT